jgi:tRNA(Arg) A34 adenosine deaminase TadA
MRKAISLAMEGMANNHGGPFGAVIVRDGMIIGQGYNRVTDSKDPTDHAEIVAIRAACKLLGDFKLDQCIIYCSCEPCPMCMGAIYWARIKKVYYACSSYDASEASFDDSFISEQLVQSPEKRAIPAIQLLRDEALELFREWHLKEDKTHY